MRLIKSLVGVEGFGRGENEQYVPVGHEVGENGEAAAAVYLVEDALADELLGFTERWALSDQELDKEADSAMVKFHAKEKADRKKAAGKSDAEEVDSSELTESEEDSKLEEEAIADAEDAGGPEDESEEEATEEGSESESPKPKRRKTRKKKSE